MPSATPTAKELALRIGGEQFRFWSEIEIGRHLDSYATCDVKAPYEPDRKEFRAAFKPFSYPDFDVTRGGKPLFTGTLVSVDPEIDAKKRAVSGSGYAKPGVLVDCTLPQGIEREFRKMTLRDIALKVTERFGIDVEFRGDPGAAFTAGGLELAAAPSPRLETQIISDSGAKFTKQKIEVTQKVHDFLESLAQQRNFVMSSTARGALLFWKSTKGGAPVARFKSGERPIVSVKPIFRNQSYFSEITGYSTSRRKKRTKHTEINPWLPSSRFRPTAKIFNDVEAGDIPEATRAELGRMFGEAASWEIELPTHEDPQGNLWEPNTTLTLEAPDAMIYRETELVIRSVFLRQKAAEQSAKLVLVLPGAFSGEVPKVLPWA
jgi:prophage tail gpP-like protein